MYRVMENIASNHKEIQNEERLLATMRFEAHAKMYCEWVAENCMEQSTIFLQMALAPTATNKQKWITIRVYQPLKIREPYGNK